LVVRLRRDARARTGGLADLRDFLAANPPEGRLVPGAARLVAALQARGVAVYLISGGFRELTLPVARALGVPKGELFAAAVAAACCCCCCLLLLLLLPAVVAAAPVPLVSFPPPALPRQRPTLSHRLD
jgi:hypothetical protein